MGTVGKMGPVPSVIALADLLSTGRPVPMAALDAPSGTPGGGVPPSTTSVLVAPPGLVQPPTPTRLDRVLQHVPVIGVGLINSTASHWGSAALLYGIGSAIPALAPPDPLTWTATVERYWANFGFAALIGIPIFTGLEGICSKNPAGRAWWRKFWHTDLVVSGVKKGWQWLTGRQVVKAADRYLTDGLTFRRSLRVKTPAVINSRGKVTQWRKEGIVLEVDYWGSVKQDIGALALYGKELVLRGIVGVTSLFTRRMPEAVGWAARVKGLLNNPLRRRAHRKVHNRVLERHLSQERLRILRGVESGARAAVVSTILLESESARRKVDAWMERTWWGRAARYVDHLSSFIGRAFPGTGGRFSGAGADLAGNVTTDIISADILSGGMTSLVGSIGPSAIISVSGALTNSGLAELMQRAPAEPGWTYGQAFTCRMLLAVPRSWVFRALCASPRSPWILRYGATAAIGLYSLIQAEQWTRHAREHFGLLLPPDGPSNFPSSEEEWRREVEQELVRRLGTGA